MTQFNVGDKVRRTVSENGMDAGTEWIVREVSSMGLRLEKDGEDYLRDIEAFELIEPAEIEQATAILDKIADDDGWWSIAPDFGQTYSDIAHAAVTCGLEVRVQVRRVQS